VQTDDTLCWEEPRLELVEIDGLLLVTSPRGDVGARDRHRRPELLRSGERRIRQAARRLAFAGGRFEALGIAAGRSPLARAVLRGRRQDGRRADLPGEGRVRREVRDPRRRHGRALANAASL